MSVFNPMILDASIQKITSSLRDDEKAEVLLFAAQHLDLQRHRTTVENAVQSCLQIPNLEPSCAARVRMLRVQARIACGVRQGIHQELQAVLALNPEHVEAKQLLFPTGKPGEQKLAGFRPTPELTNELWREVASLLPRRDLKVLLSVPHVLSRIASKLLFQDLTLRFGVPHPKSSHYTQGIGLPRGKYEQYDNQHDDVMESRNAEILTRIITDQEFAGVVKTLRIFVHNPKHNISFARGMLSTALPKMLHLKNVVVQAKWADITAIVGDVSKYQPNIRGLWIRCLDSGASFHAPALRNVTYFAYEVIDIVSTDGSRAIAQPESFLAQNREFLRALSLKSWPMSAAPIPMRHLSSLSLHGKLDSADALETILRDGQQLQFLALRGSLHCIASAAFAACRGIGALPALTHFDFQLESAGGQNPGAHDSRLFTAIADFVRDRRKLRYLGLQCSTGHLLKAVGFDASVWGLLPSLTGLTTLAITLPEDVAPGLASWLLPRGLINLTVGGFLDTAKRQTFASQLRPGLPHKLRYIFISDSLCARIREEYDTTVRTLAHELPDIQLVEIERFVWRVSHEKSSRSAHTSQKLELWSDRQTELLKREWFEWAGCDDALWPDVF